MKPRTAEHPASPSWSNQANCHARAKNPHTPTRRKAPTPSASRKKEISGKAATPSSIAPTRSGNSSPERKRATVGLSTQTYKKANPFASLLKSFKRGGAA